MKEISERILLELDLLCMDNFVKWDLWAKMPVDLNRGKYKTIIQLYEDIKSWKEPDEQMFE